MLVSRKLAQIVITMGLKKMNFVERRALVERYEEKVYPDLLIVAKRRLICKLWCA